MNITYLCTQLILSTVLSFMSNCFAIHFELLCRVNLNHSSHFPISQSESLLDCLLDRNEGTYMYVGPHLLNHTPLTEVAGQGFLLHQTFPSPLHTHLLTHHTTLLPLLTQQARQHQRTVSHTHTFTDTKIIPLERI